MTATSEQTSLTSPPLGVSTGGAEGSAGAGVPAGSGVAGAVAVGSGSSELASASLVPPYPAAVPISSNAIRPTIAHQVLNHGLPVAGPPAGIAPYGGGAPAPPNPGAACPNGDGAGAGAAEND
jgi:hypothetical protein